MDESVAYKENTRGCPFVGHTWSFAMNPKQLTVIFSGQNSVSNSMVDYIQLAWPKYLAAQENVRPS
jgi:hypothetical protein